MHDVREAGLLNTPISIRLVLLVCPEVANKGPPWSSTSRSLSSVLVGLRTRFPGSCAVDMQIPLPYGGELVIGTLVLKNRVAGPCVRIGNLPIQNSHLDNLSSRTAPLLRRHFAQTMETHAARRGFERRGRSQGGVSIEMAPLHVGRCISR